MMLCERCMVIMKSGTTYEQKKREREKQITHKRFCQCPKCKDRFYVDSINFQDYLVKASKKK